MAACCSRASTHGKLPFKLKRALRGTSGIMPWSFNFTLTVRDAHELEMTWIFIPQTSHNLREKAWQNPLFRVNLSIFMKQKYHKNAMIIYAADSS